MRWLLVTSAICLPFFLVPNPVGPQVIQGEASFQSSVSTLEVTAGAQSVIHWQNFSINEGEMTRFVQPSADSAVLNKVVGGNLSQIMGRLEANGKVFLINPSGIIIGSEGIVQTASFIASTLDVAIEDFLRGDELLFKGDSEASLVHLGKISTSQGYAALFARKIEQKGEIEAGQSAYVVTGGEILVRMDQNEGLIIASSQRVGQVNLEGQIRTNPYALAIQLEERNEVECVEEQGRYLIRPKITLQTGQLVTGENSGVAAPEGVVEIALGEGISELNGQILAREGTIHLNGPEAHVYNMGLLDVSGSNGGSVQIDVARYGDGGTLRALGEKKGGSIAITAPQSSIQTRSSSIDVSGETGGKIDILTEKGRLFSSGRYWAQGKVEGGSVRLSGHEVALAGGKIDASGAAGGGTVLIGGGVRGEDSSMFNAENVSLNSSSSIQAGKGGTAVVFATNKTSSHAAISALDGFVEISGKQSLSNTSKIELGHGKLLLDPKNITLDSGAGLYPQFLLVDPDPSGGGTYGSVNPLTNVNNVLLFNTGRNVGSNTNVGAVYLYDGVTFELLGALTGSTTNDEVGSGSYTELTNGNIVISSPDWNNGDAAAAGASTFMSTTGFIGAVSPSNSLVGGTTDDLVGNMGATALLNGNYAVVSTAWNNPDTSATQAGAFTWSDGTVVGLITASNSCVGINAYDTIGNTGILVLTNGNYVVASNLWNNSLGAVTFANGSSPFTGNITAENSLIGSTPGDEIGNGALLAVGTTNYVVGSSSWTSSTGAVTWGSGTTGIVGEVSASNSLIGDAPGDAFTNIVVLPSNDYVVVSQHWANYTGAVTWGSGNSGVVGVTGISNSLVGTNNGDQVGSGGVVSLTNGNYLVLSPDWTNLSPASMSAGAVTWAPSTGLSGVMVSSSNSIVGGTTDDQVGTSVTALTNGNYVVSTSDWTDPSGPITGVGAATWGDGSAGTVYGLITSSNSLIGSNPSDSIGFDGILALSNGNYVVLSSDWNSFVGAATFGNGASGTSGVVSSSNSLTGSTTGDEVANNGAVEVGTHNYVVQSGTWNSSTGAVTWVNGTDGTLIGDAPKGAVVSMTNSLIGTKAGDALGNSTVTVLNENKNYVVVDPSATIGGISSAGSVTWGDGNAGIAGTVSSSNSIVGSTTGDSVGGGSRAISGGITALTNGNYVIYSPDWQNGGSTVGAVTFALGTEATTLTISSSNSLIGSSSIDEFGSGGITALESGNYAVISPLWSNYSGAVTWGDGEAGISGEISSENSLIGASSGDEVGLGGLTELEGCYNLVKNTSWGAGDGSFSWARSWTTGTVGPISNANTIFGLDSYSGFVEVVLASATSTYYLYYNTQILAGLYIPNQLTYESGAAQDLTIDPAALTDIVNFGTSVLLQASNDVTVTSPLVVNADDAGNLTISAGRSLTINASITGGANQLTFLANAPLSDGVVDAERDAGDAVLSLADGVVVSTVSGNISLNLSAGTGKTHSDSGNFTLGSGSAVTSTSGTILVESAKSLAASGAATISSTNSSVTLVVDTLYPTSPDFGTGAFDVPDVTFTSGNLLQFYGSYPGADTLPSTINGAAFSPGDHTTFDVYYDNGSGGIPYAFFYKTDTGPSPPPPLPPSPTAPSQTGLSSNHVASYITANSEALYFWQFSPFWPVFSMQKPSLLEGDVNLKEFWITHVGNQEIYE